jgi:hypothetical protein
MTRFLIELPHDPEYFSCARFIDIFRTTGSHFLTHAAWGCPDGRHMAWLMVDADSHDEARLVVPPAFRHQARVTRLGTFEVEDLNLMRALHPPVELQVPA